MVEHECDVCGIVWSCFNFNCIKEKNLICSKCEYIQEQLDEFYEKNEKAVIDWIHKEWPHGIQLNSKVVNI